MLSLLERTLNFTMQLTSHRVKGPLGSADSYSVSLAIESKFSHGKIELFVETCVTLDVFQVQPKEINLVVLGRFNIQLSACPRCDPKASLDSPSGKFERLFPPSSFVIAPLRLGGGGISCKKRREIVSTK